MERRSQSELTFRSRAEICEEHRLAAGWRTLGDRLSRRLWLLQSESLLTEAWRGTELEDFGDPPIEPALSILRVWEVMFPIPTASRSPNKVDPRVRKAEASCGGSAGSLREWIRFTRCARGRRMSAWRSIVSAEHARAARRSPGKS